MNEGHARSSAASHANHKCEIFRPALPPLPNHKEHESSQQISSLKAFKGKSSWSPALASSPCSCKASWCVQVVQTIWGGLWLQQRGQVPQEHCIYSLCPAWVLCCRCLTPPEAHRSGCSILTHPSGSHETHRALSPIQPGKGAKSSLCVLPGHYATQSLAMTPGGGANSHCPLARHVWGACNERVCH